MESQTEQKEEVRPKEQIVDPWRAIAGEGQATIDYNKLIGRPISYLRSYVSTRQKHCVHEQINSAARGSTKLLLTESPKFQGKVFIIF